MFLYIIIIQVNGCYGEYTSWYESKQDYGPGNSSAWQYASSDDIDGSKHSGSMGVYNGGGYIINLGEKRSESEAILADLKDQLWIDRGTRAVFIDFSVYNANINLFCVVRSVFTGYHLITFPVLMRHESHVLPRTLQTTVRVSGYWRSCRNERVPNCEAD